MSKVIVTATVQVEVSAGWNGALTLDQIYQQAVSECRYALERLIGGAAVLSDWQVQAVITEKHDAPEVQP